MERRYTRRGFVACASAVFSGCLGSGGGDGDGSDCEGAPVDEGTEGAGGGGAGNRTEDGAGRGKDDGDNITDNSDDDVGNNTDGEASENETGNETADESLDLREANVVAVSVREDEEGTHTFDVTLYHDDDGEEGYANWWQVESLGGDCLGRRVLTHAHGTRRFTRSETIETEDETCVVVRGHDQTHGYGGRAVVVDTETGRTEGFRQGEDALRFDEDDCP